jgi:hypothetical protein
MRKVADGFRTSLHHPNVIEISGPRLRVQRYEPLQTLNPTEPTFLEQSKICRNGTVAIKCRHTVQQTYLTV